MRPIPATAGTPSGSDSLLRPRSSLLPTILAYIGINAAESAPSPKSFRKRFGMVNANVNADQIGPAPNAAAAIISRSKPSTRLTSVIAPIKRACETKLRVAAGVLAMRPMV